MADLADQATQQLLRTIVREETRAIVRDETRAIVRDETDDLRQTLADHTKILHAHTKTLVDHTATLANHTVILGDHTKLLNSHAQTLELLREVQGSQSLTLRAIATDMSQLKQSFRWQGILFEDLEDRFTFLAEAVSDSLTLRQQVQDHETRLLQAES